MNRIVKLNDDKSFELTYNNRAKALLENLENKEIIKIIGDITEKLGIVKIDVAVNVIFTGLKYTDDGKKMSRDDVFEMLPESAVEVARIMGEIVPILLKDTGLTRENKSNKEDNEGK